MINEDMTFDYNKESKEILTIFLENGEEITGEFTDVRIDPNTIPKGKEWYQFRHSDYDGGEIASLKRGCLMVNFFGTFICEPIQCLEQLGGELDVVDYSFDILS